MKLRQIQSTSGRGGIFYGVKSIADGLHGFKLTRRRERIGDMIIPGFVVPIVPSSQVATNICGSDHLDYNEDLVVVEVDMPPDLTMTIKSEVEVIEWGSIGSYSPGTPVLLSHHKSGKLKSMPGDEAVILSPVTILDIYDIEIPPLRLDFQLRSKNVVSTDDSRSMLRSSATSKVIIW